MDKNENICALLVWAKFSRYPWWPAFLTGVKAEDMFEVKFFGTFEYSMLKENCIKAFTATPNFDQKDVRNKGLQAAIESACSVRDGRSTIAEEMEKALRGEQAATPSPKKCKRVKLSEECTATESSLSDLLHANTSLIDELSNLNPSDLGNAQTGRDSIPKEEPFETLYKKLKLFFDKLNDFGSEFPHNFEVFCSLLRACLEECYMKQVVSSDVGRLLMQLKQGIQASNCPKVQRRVCLYEINSLATSMKRKILNYFFAKNLEETDLGNSSCLDVTDKIMEIAFYSKSENKASSLHQRTSKHTSSHRNANKQLEDSEIEDLKEKFKLSIDIRNRILKKFSKIILQNSNQKISKIDSERLARSAHEEIYKQSLSLMEYKRRIVQFVQHREDIRNFFLFGVSNDTKCLSNLFCEQILPLILK